MSLEVIATIALIAMLAGLLALLSYLAVRKEQEIRRRERAALVDRVAAAARLDEALRSVASANAELADALKNSREVSR